MKRKIYHILYNPFISDSRVTKELITIERLYPNDSITLLCRFKAGLPKEEKLGNKIKILRIGPEDKKNSRIYKFINWLHWFSACSKLLFSKQFHILHCHDLTGIPVGVFFKLIREFKLIYDSHEFQSEIQSVANWKKPILRLFEHFFILQTDILITVSNSISRNYEHLFGRKNSYVILNVPDKVEIVETQRPHFFPVNKKIILFQGGLSPNRGIEKSIEAFNQSNLDEYCLIFMGTGPLENLIKSQQNEKIVLVPPVSFQELPFISSHADVGLLFYENTCKNHFFCMPNKIFEYINSEIPVISSNLYETSQLIGDYKIGVTINEMSAQNLIENLEYISKNRVHLKKMLRNAKNVFDWKNEEEKIAHLYR